MNRIAVRAFADILGVSIQALADGAGIDRGSLSKALDGKRPIEARHLPSFAATLGVPIGALVGPPEAQLAQLIAAGS